MPYPGLVHPEPLPLQQATADPHLHKRCSNIALAQSLWVSGSWCTQGLFESSEHLWQVRGLILNMTSPLLPSCWGFSFALGRGVSFFGGIQHSPVDGCSARGCNFGVLAGDECTSFYSTVLHYVLLLCHLYNCSRFHQPPYLPCYSSIECYSLLQILSFLS